jgi:hypothetical protein
MSNEMAVSLPGTPLHMLVVVGAWPLLPTFMSMGLRLGVLQLMLLLLRLPLLLWDMRLPGLARAELLVLVLVLVMVGAYMWLVVGPLVVLMQLLVLARARSCCMGSWTESSIR